MCGRLKQDTGFSKSAACQPAAGRLPESAVRSFPVWKTAKRKPALFRRWLFHTFLIPGLPVDHMRQGALIPDFMLCGHIVLSSLHVRLPAAPCRGTGIHTARKNPVWSVSRYRVSIPCLFISSHAYCSNAPAIPWQRFSGSAYTAQRLGARSFLT